MSVQLMAKIWQAPLPMTEKIVLLKMADCANDDGEAIWPSVGRMARECGCTDRHIQNVVGKYQEAGLLKLVAGENTTRKTREYAFNMEALDALTPEPRSPHPRTSFGGTPEPRSPKPSLEPSSNLSVPNGTVASATESEILDLDALLYRQGRALLGKRNGALITKLKKSKGSVVEALKVLEAAKRKADPVEYVAGAISGKAKRETEIQRALDKVFENECG